MNNVCSSGGTVASPVQSETLPEIAEQTAKMLAETESILNRILEIIEGNMGDDLCGIQEPSCFQGSVMALRNRAARLTGLSHALLDNFQA